MLAGANKKSLCKIFDFILVQKIFTGKNTFILQTPEKMAQKLSYLEGLK